MADTPNQAAVTGPSITAYLNAQMAAKWRDPAYFSGATERWIAAVEQVLINQGDQDQKIGQLIDLIMAQGQELQAMQMTLAEILDRLPPKPGAAAGGALTFTIAKEPPDMASKMKLNLQDSQTAIGTITLHDANNIEGATPDAPPTWTATPAGIDLTPSADGLTCQAKIGAGAAAGPVVVTATVVGGGVSFNLDNSADPLNIVAGAATGGGLGFQLAP